MSFEIDLLNTYPVCGQEHRVGWAESTRLVERGDAALTAVNAGGALGDAIASMVRRNADTRHRPGGETLLPPR